MGASLTGDDLRKLAHALDVLNGLVDYGIDATGAGTSSLVLTLESGAEVTARQRRERAPADGVGPVRYEIETGD